MANGPQSHFADVDGVKYHYHDIGTGEPLILIHGGGPGASGWSNYSRNVEALSRQFRLIIPDLVGYGQSDKPVLEGPRFGIYAKGMLGLMSRIGIEKAHVVGNSLGGGTAIKMALEAPDRIGRLILMGPAGLLAPSTPMPTLGVRQIMEFYGGEGPTREKLRAFLQTMVYDSSFLTEELLDGRIAAATQPDLLANPPLGRGGPPPIEALWKENLAGITHDTLILWGREDRVNPMDMHLTLLAQLPNAQFTVFTRCGHWVQWEKAKAFNALVASFVRGEMS
ncbi:alpha/beta hydrolase fold [Rhizorhabdus wittichii RW1]|uniref:Alpha/beta hydrolase fold n=1 Tax=Rhizorhabdus wittichii (strain DSM 6014 / CCUG 31198 / JCM 15750 / NBRC 105917 / EY 4224 / RW1) TaxID=392499 RepID=A0A9J9HF26_RHIWR|nr:alpha/beta hydrolase fold [Rhizorhabdus wittichii RW1]